MTHHARPRITMRLAATTAAAALLFGGLTTAATAQPQPPVAVGIVNSFPTAPSPSAPFDWKQRALDYDAFVYDWTDRGDYSTIRADISGLNLPAGETTYKMPAYYGDTRTASSEGDGKQEALNQIASVVGATLVGIDKSNQDGYNYVDMLRTFYHADLGVVSNTPSDASDAPGSQSIWYRTVANVLYYMLGSQYPDATDMTGILRSIADEYTDMLTTLGGPAANITMQDFDFRTGTKMTGRNEGGEAAAGAAAILLWAHAKFDDPRYLEAAQWSMDALERSGSNLYYEVVPVLAPYIAARLNAEQNTSYDVSKYLGWLIQDSSPRQGWGTLSGTWGGKDVSGLSGSRNDSGGYAFAMNSFATPLLAATAKYDARYASTIGRWMLNVHNASRFFYADQMPASQQYYGSTYIDDPAHVIAYEGLMKTGPQGILARGDIPERSGSWGVGPSARSLGLYGSSWVGFMGATLATTNVANVLRTDLNALDFFGDNSSPTFLYYNPNSTLASVEVVLDGTHDLYDAVTDRVIATAVSGTTAVEVPAGSSVVLVVAPPNATVATDGTKTTLDGLVVGYDRSPQRDLALGATVTASATAAGSDAASVTDGLSATAWSADSPQAQTLTVDLTGTYDVSRVALRWGAQHAPVFTISGSVDGKLWTPLVDVAAGRGGAETADFTSGRARYLRLELSEMPAGSAPASLAALEVYGGDLAASAPVVVSSAVNGLNIASNLTDGSPSTRWESTASDPQWAIIDLGETHDLGTVRLRWETAAAKAYGVDVSDDGTNWTPVYTTATGAGGSETIALPAGIKGRFVRMYGTKRLTKYAYSLYSMEVFAPSGDASTGLIFGDAKTVAGAAFTVTGRGFAPNETVTLAWDHDDHQVTVQAEADGGFTADTVAPTAGARVLTAQGTSSGSRSDLQVTIDQADPSTPVLSVSTMTVLAGEQVEVRGTAFPSDAQLTLTLHSAPVSLGSTTADSSGAFTTTVTVPADTEPGKHNIIAEARDGISAAVEITVKAPVEMPVDSTPTTVSGDGGPGGDGTGSTGSGTPGRTSQADGTQRNLATTGTSLAFLVPGTALLLLLGTGCVTAVRRRNRA